MIKRILLFFVGIILLPFCVVITKTSITLIMSVNAGDSLIPAPLLAFATGFVVWHLIFIFLSKPVRTYVLAHELTHALWGMMMGAKVSKMKVAKDSGFVMLSKTNLLITLAPYFFPLYTVLTIIAYYILSIWFDVQQYHLFWLALVGFTWAFHIDFTISTLMQHQSDIQIYGHLFSYAVIYIFNMLGICLWIVMVSDATFEKMMSSLGQESLLMAIFLKNSVVYLYNKLQ